MWKYFRILLPLFVIAFAVPMIMPGPDGKPVMSVKDWVPDQTTFSKIKNKVKDVINQAADQTAKLSNSTADSVTAKSDHFLDRKNQLYKWKDKHGRWQFTDRFDQVPEYALAQLQVDKMPKAVNTMVAPPIVEAQAEVNNQQPFGDGKIGIDKLPQLVDEAKKVKAMMEERNKKLEQF
ncbi:MAG: hypothetical protein ACJA0N_001419 [Pseudohongiellaceae bacterium]|jgi:hypothetical protein